MAGRFVLAISGRVYSWLLLAFPLPFRRRYAEEMAALFRLRCERALVRGGLLALLACSIRGCLDAAGGAAADRLAPRRRAALFDPAPRGDSMLVHLTNDVRTAVRAFGRQPLFTLAVVGTLAVGIGATTTVFGIVDGAVLRPLRYGDADRLVSIVQKDPRFGTVPFAPPYLPELRAGLRTVEQVAGFSPSWQHALTGSGEARVATGAYVSDGLLDLFGVTPVRGRAFTQEEYAPGGPRVALVSERFWQRQFGEAALADQTIRLDGVTYTVVGILPDRFRMPITASTVSRNPQAAELWLPFSFNPYVLARSIPVMNVVARLRSGQTTAAAQQEASALAAALTKEDPAALGELQVVTLTALITRQARTPLLILLGAVGMLLLIACANVGHMLLARAAGRETEMAVRTSLGATPARLAVQLLAESATLAAAGGAAGLAVAWWALGVVPALGFPGLPPSTQIGLDWRVAGFALGAALATALLVGVLPALRASRRPASGLKDGARTVGGTARALRNTLVFAEVALAVVLLVGAGLLARSFMLLTAIDPGFSAERVIAGTVALPAARYATAESRLAFADQALARLSALPGVERAALVNRLPFGGGNVLVGVEVEGQSQADGAPITTDRRVVSPGYFGAMRIPVLDGRTFDDRQTGEAERVAIVNAAAARRFWPDGRALDRRVRLMLRGGPGPWLRIVGIVGDVRHHGLDQPAQPEVYVPYSQAAVESFTLLIRTTGDPRPLATSLRAQIRALDADLPVDPVSTADAAIRASVAEPRLRAALLNLFAVMALVLAALGVYGVVSFSVARSTRDIGLRIALGAPRGRILRMVLGQGLGIVGAGLLTGLAASILVSRFLERLLFGVSPNDPLTLAIVAAVLLVVAFVASYLPARRAMHLDPVQALRVE